MGLCERNRGFVNRFAEVAKEDANVGSAG